MQSQYRAMHALVHRAVKMENKYTFGITVDRVIAKRHLLLGWSLLIAIVF